MTTFFDRRARLIVGPEGGEGREITGLRISFDIEKTKSIYPNTAKIEVYNLSPETAAIVQSGKRRNTVQLYAGHGDIESRIFVGEIRKAETTFNGPERITRIEAKDGGRKYRSARVNRSFGAEVTTGQIIAELSKSFGSPIKVPQEVADIRLTGGFVASGQSADLLRDLATTLGLDVTFEDDVLKVTRKGYASGEAGILLTPDTGLVGSPKPTKKGIEATSLLNPGIRPKRIVEIRTPSLQGFYIVQKVGHAGDTHDTPFYTKFEGRQIRV